MKKLILSLFAISVVAFANTSTDSKDRASVDVEVKAVIVNKTQLIVTEDFESYNAITKTTVDFGTLDKQLLHTAPNEANSTVRTKTLYVKRLNNEPVLLDGQKNVVVSISDGSESLSLGATNSSSTITGTFKIGEVTNRNPYAGFGEDIPGFDITTSLNHDSINKAHNGSYTGSKTINIAINN
jgi:hypothetical protein